MKAFARIAKLFQDPRWTRVLSFLFILAYAYTINWSYRNVETTLFEYQGLRYSPPAIELVIFGYILVALAFFFMPNRMKKPSDMAVWITFVTLVVPMCFFPFHVTTLERMEMVKLVVPVIAAFGLYAVLLRLPPIDVNPIQCSRRGFTLVLLGAIICFTFMVAAMNGFRLELSLEDAYARRLEAREIATGGSLGGYALAWLGGSLAPLAITYGVYRKLPILIIAGVVGLLAIFSFSGTKQSLFTPLIMMLLFALVRKGRASFNILIPAGAICLILMSAFMWVKMKNPILSESFTRRLIVSKGVSTTFYYEQFREDPKLMRDSIFATLIGLPAVTSKARIVGMRYGFGENDNYNANAWASMFGNFGYPGLFLVSIVAAMILRVVDGMARHGNFEVLCVFAAFFAIVWGEQAIETTLLSSGVLISLILLLMLSGVRQREPSEALKNPLHA